MKRSNTTFYCKILQGIKK